MASGITELANPGSTADAERPSDTQTVTLYHLWDGVHRMATLLTSTEAEYIARVIPTSGDIEVREEEVAPSLLPSVITRLDGDAPDVPVITLHHIGDAGGRLVTAICLQDANYLVRILPQGHMWRDEQVDPSELASVISRFDDRLPLSTDEVTLYHVVFVSDGSWFLTTALLPEAENCAGQLNCVVTKARVIAETIRSKTLTELLGHREGSDLSAELIQAIRVVARASERAEPDATAMLREWLDGPTAH
jgi:hypothetical protein